MSLWVKGSAGLFTTPNVWSDHSGNGFDLTGPGGAGQPTAGAGINGHATCDFSGASQFLETAGGVFLAQLVSVNVFSVFIVQKYTGAFPRLGNLFTPPLIIDTSGDFAVFSFLSAGNGEFWGSTEAHLNAGLNSNTFAGGAAKRLSFIQAGVAVGGNQQSITFSGGAPTTEDGLPVTGLSLASQLCVGFWNGTGARAFAGSIGEIIIYPFALSGAQQTATEAYLDGFWGV